MPRKRKVSIRSRLAIALGLALGLLDSAMEIDNLDDLRAWQDAVRPVVKDMRTKAAVLGVTPTEIKSIQ